ncbi:DUF1554 domain-containing protein [Sorangium sp. So ce1014]|uniref:DUF1554 domain-containing protein n=1 Tax=Sorangium sp. So ce1014 TaxID=3133326 RepID=UPI003F6010F7
MKRSRSENLRNLGILLGLGFSLAIAGCGDEEGGGSAGTTTSSSSTTSGGTPSGSTATSGSGGGGGGTGGSDGGTGGSGGAGGASGTGGSGGSDAGPSLSFFVSSTGSPTANLGGLAGADSRCQELAEAVGAGAKTWRAYLSVEKGPNDQPVHAKDRIGAGPWYNAELVMVAANIEELHSRFGDHTVFLDEKGEMVPGQWPNSPTPNQHDILTGTDRNGTLKAGQTCADWTSEDAGQTAWVGHSDGTGPNQSMADMYRPWNSVHSSGSCADTAPGGGNGRVYCFAAN